MSRFSRIEVAQVMKDTGILPLYYNADAEICLEVIKACYNGGLRTFEFTNRGDFAHEVFSELNKKVIARYPDMILGTGSVVDAPTAAIYMQLGANFIVSPSFHEDVAEICNLRKVLWIPGCGSVTEISQAEKYGAEVIKIFPGTQVGGPGFIKAITGPKPRTNIMPTGGVEPTEDNLSKWFASGAYCVGMGSKLITKDIIENRDFLTLEKTVKNAVDIVKKIRNDKKSG